MKQLVQRKIWMRMIMKRRMIKPRIILILVFVFTLFYYEQVQTQGYVENRSKLIENSKQLKLTFQYTMHDNITIVNDTDFHIQAKGHWDVQGLHSGNTTHPYITIWSNMSRGETSITWYYLLLLL